MSVYSPPTVTLLGRIISRAEQDRGFAVESVDGWTLGIIERENANFDAVLVRPGGSISYVSRLRASASEAIEKACGYLHHNLGRPDAAAALRTLAMLEAKSWTRTP